MIARIWRCTVTRDNLPRYLEYFKSSVLPVVTRIAGFSDVSILEHERPGYTELTLISHWASMDAISQFAGSNPETAVVAPAAQALLRTCDATVTHHTVLWTAQSTSVPADMQPTARFSVRVPYYHTYRPRYPKAVIDTLASYGLTPDSIVADIGAGTGISSEMFLEHGCTVYAVEPNAEMRAACEHIYGERPNFRVVDGTAEATTLADHSIDWITAGQAFHWFDHTAARTEFARILRHGGGIALFWNDRAENVSDFVNEYNTIMRVYDIEQGSTPRAQNLIVEEDQIAGFFAPAGYERIEVANPIDYDFDTLKGRAVSSSYAPLPGHARHDEMVAALRAVYDRHQVNGRVRMDYITQIYVGHPNL